MAEQVSLLAAFVAGILSITSPCVLPLIPLYLSHLAGVSVTADGVTSRKVVMANAAAYVAGFSTVFIAVGIAFGAAGMLVTSAEVIAGNRFWLVRIGGVLVLLLGLQQMGLIRIPFLDQERRLSLEHPNRGTLGSSYLIGLTFGAGWSPCAGPILGAILTMAAAQGDPRRSAILLAVYSLGLGIPFLLAAYFGSAPKVVRWLGPHTQTLATISGAVMVAIGAIMVLGIYEQLFSRIASMVPWTPIEPRI